MERFNFAVKNIWSEVHSNSNINFIGSLCPKATQQSSGEFILNDTAKKGNSKGAFIYYHMRGGGGVLFWKSIKGGCHILSSHLRGVD